MTNVDGQRGAAKRQALAGPIDEKKPLVPGNQVLNKDGESGRVQRWQSPGSARP